MKYVQYGCGLSAPTRWLNFDSSPTLRLQKIPFFGVIAKKKVDFPENVYFGDIVKGLPNIAQGSCKGVYCSHVLEHLSLYDLRTALKNTYSILEQGGVFRCVLPDLSIAIDHYLADKKTFSDSASIRFMESTLLGFKKRPRGLTALAQTLFGNSHHLWMWDYESLAKELKDAGFSETRKCNFNDSKEPAFLDVENQGRFLHALAIEAIK